MKVSRNYGVEEAIASLGLCKPNRRRECRVTCKCNGRGVWSNERDNRSRKLGTE